MKFYVASSLANREDVRSVSSELMNRGFTHTYDWTVNGRADTYQALETIGIKEKEAIMASDMVIILLPGGKGSHIEMGIAMGAGKKVYLHSFDEAVFNIEQASTFYLLPEIERIIGTLDKLVEAVCSVPG